MIVFDGRTECRGISSFHGRESELFENVLMEMLKSENIVDKVFFLRQMGGRINLDKSSLIVY